MTGHSPTTATAELAAKLSSRTRHVSLLLGAGSSCAAGLPDVSKLLESILEKLDPAPRSLAQELYKNRNLEEGLTRLRRIRSLLDPGETLSGLTVDSAAELEQLISSAIIRELVSIDPKMDASVALASWAAGEFYSRPIEIFTVNYDLIIENGLERVGATYFDGFVGNINARFRPDLVEAKVGSTSLPSSFVRLWKLHGSLNWVVARDGDVRRTGGAVDQAEMAAIYPSDDKYNQSRRMPFVVLQDRFRRALAEPESLTLVCGYSFGDEHLNEVLFDAARRYPRSEIVILCFGPIPVIFNDLLSPNVTVMGADEAILAGVRLPWTAPEDDLYRQNVWQDGKFTLGDFNALAQFLAKSRRPDTPWIQETPASMPTADATSTKIS